MREIKFRAWDKENKQMSWPFTLYDTPTWETSSGGYTLTDEEFTVAPIMQFTGLNDKNGVEIYEGDILKVAALELPPDEGGFVKKEDQQIVEWQIIADGRYDESLYAGFHICIGEVGYGKPARDTDTCCEIIGNIHQNPELLKKGE